MLAVILDVVVAFCVVIAWASCYGGVLTFVALQIIEDIEENILKNNV